MSHKQLTYLLEKMTPAEHKGFLRLLDSPYFNTDPKLTHLGQLLTEGEGDRETLHRALFPELEYDYFRISNLLSYVYKLLERFLALEHMKADRFVFANHALALSRERGWHAHFEKLSRDLAKDPARRDKCLPGDFLESYLVEQERDEYFGAQQKRTFDQSLSHRMEDLEHFYVADMLRSVCKWINRQNIIRAEETHSYEHFVAYVQENFFRYEAHPFIRIYFHILMTLTEWEKESHYAQLIEVLKQHSSTLPASERKPMYQYAQNYCTRQINNGNTAYLRELFGLYNEVIRQDLLYHEGYIGSADVKNIVSLGIRLEEYDWTEQFLESNEDRFQPAMREAVIAYNRAQLAYVRGSLRGALRLLRVVEFDDLYYDLGAKTLLLKIYYDLDDLEGLESLLHAFSNSLRRNKHISTYQLTVHKNLIRYTQKANRLRHRKRLVGAQAFRKQVETLEAAIHTTREITNIGWLLEKVKELTEA